MNALPCHFKLLWSTDLSFFCLIRKGVYAVNDNSIIMIVMMMMMVMIKNNREDDVSSKAFTVSCDMHISTASV